MKSLLSPSPTSPKPAAAPVPIPAASRELRMSISTPPILLLGSLLISRSKFCISWAIISSMEVSCVKGLSPAESVCLLGCGGLDLRGLLSKSSNEAERFRSPVPEKPRLLSPPPSEGGIRYLLFSSPYPPGLVAAFTSSIHQGSC